MAEGPLFEHHTSELSDELLELGSALIVATVGPDGEPRAARAGAWRVVDAAARRVRVAVGADDPLVVDNLGGRPGGAHISVTGADVATLRSLQLKGRVVAVEPPDADDRELIERHRDVFVGKIEATDGHPRDVVYRFLPATYVMVDLIVAELYDQTPGPDAGSVLRVGGP